MIAKLLDYAGLGITAFIGFMNGLIALLVGEIFGGSLLVVLGAAIVGALICLIASRIYTLGDELFGKGLSKLFGDYRQGVLPADAIENREKAKRRFHHIAFVGATIFAVILGSFVDPSTILGYI